MHGRDLDALVGRWARLRPTDGDALVPEGQAQGSSAPRGGPGVDWVEVAVVSNLDDVLRCETRDRRAVALGGRPVLVELGADQAMIRLGGMLRVMIAHPLPVVLAVTASGPLEHLQRRQWVRARVTVPVALSADARHGDVTLRTSTLDLSGGGVRLQATDAVGIGESLSLTLWLPSGAVEVDGTVLESDEDGVRVAFDQMPESVAKRLARFVFDVQIHRQRAPFV